MIDFIFVLVNGILIATISFLSWKKEEKILKPFFLPALVLKLLAGMCVGLIYSRYYETGDTFQYFEDGKTLAAIAWKKPFQYLTFLWNEENSPILGQLRYSDARALFFVKFVSVLNLISHNNYWIASAYCSLISFFGTINLIRAINRFMPEFTLPASVAFLFFPSVVFWTSGLIKESLAGAALFYLTALFLQGWFGNPIEVRKGIVGALALWILWGLKYYYAAVFIPVVFTCFVYKHLFIHLFKLTSSISKALLWFGIFLFPLLLISFAHPNFYYDTFLETIVSNNAVYNQFSQPDDIISYHSLHPTFTSVALNSPMALFSGLFRPMIFEACNLLQITLSLENLILLILFLFSVPFIPRIFKSEHYILAIALSVYVTLLCIFLALSTPNFGTLSRYRAGYLPFFVMILLSNEKIILWLQRFRTSLDR